MTSPPVPAHDPDDPLDVAAGVGLPAFIADAAAACGKHAPEQFVTMTAQQAAFDGEADDAHRDYAAARQICLACPLLFRCREWAYASHDSYAFLGGETAEVRRSRQRRGDRVGFRREQVRALATRRLSPVKIAEILAVDPTTVRADLRALGLR